MVESIRVCLLFIYLLWDQFIGFGSMANKFLLFLGKPVCWTRKSKG